MCNKFVNLSLNQHDVYPFYLLVDFLFLFLSLYLALIIFDTLIFNTSTVTVKVPCYLHCPIVYILYSYFML